MTRFADYINEISPKFNREMTEGMVYHRLNRAVDYIDNFIKYSCQSKTDTGLKYLGYEELSPKDELKFLFNKKNRIVYDIAENDIYLVKFLFQYGEEEVVREHYFYLPFVSKGNVMRMSGKNLLIMPTLADKVISIGEHVIFINILTAKYNFSRVQHPVSVNGVINLAPVIVAQLYRNQSKKFPDTTKANPTIIHYLLANYGYKDTMQLLLGFVPTPTYDEKKRGCIMIESTRQAPRGYVGEAELYKPTQIKFAVKEEDFTPNVQYVLGNVFYVLDNFSERISIAELDKPLVWQRFMGEIIHSGHYGLAYLQEKMYAHFNDLNSSFDTITIRKLKDVDVEASTLIGLLGVIFQNFNEWILHADSRSLYNNKSYEVESFVLNHITSRITRLVLDINKEELRLPSGYLEKSVVDKIFKSHFSTRAVFNLRKERMYVTSIAYSGDHLYFKNTAMVVQQESDFINVGNTEANTSERGAFVASMATAGSILGLSKRNPTPLIRLNPYVTTCPNTGTLLCDPELYQIVKDTDLQLANMEHHEGIEDVDEVVSDLLSEMTDADGDDDYHVEEDFESDNWSED